MYFISKLLQVAIKPILWGDHLVGKKIISRQGL
jgi:hypothetical protein